MKCIAFGIGKIYESYCDYDIKKNIIAYVDNNVTDTSEFEEKPLIKPSQINQWVYDYIIIFSIKSFEQIFKQLVHELDIPEERIISLLSVVKDGEHIALQKCEKDILNIARKMQWRRILDFTALYSSLYYNRESMGIEKDICLDTFVPQSGIMYPIFTNLYDRILCLEDCNIPEYDAIIWPYVLKKSEDTQKEFFKKFERNVRYILAVLPYGCDDVNLDIFQYGVIIYTGYKAYGKIFIIDSKPDREEKHIKIYTVSHKEFKIPENSLYEPIYVGRYGAEKELSRSDSRGDNIAKYNLFINETTALYWIWKQSKEDYVGLCHYRRFFLQDEERDIKNILTSPFIESVLDKYDIILPQANLFDNIKVQLERHVDQRAFEKGWEIITCVIKEKQPDYWEAFEYFFDQSKIMYPCNMFVTNKKIADRYCEWLFSFILDAVEAADFSVYDSYSQRMIGFFVERLFNVWLLKQNLKIKELSVLLVDEV